MMKSDGEDEIPSEPETGGDGRREVRAKNEGDMIMEATAMANAMRRRSLLNASKYALLGALHACSRHPSSEPSPKRDGRPRWGHVLQTRANHVP
eukprot:4604729-Pyramimonas_sp.AAC.1